MDSQLRFLVSSSKVCHPSRQMGGSRRIKISIRACTNSHLVSIMTCVTYIPVCRILLFQSYWSCLSPHSQPTTLVFHHQNILQAAAKLAALHHMTHLHELLMSYRWWAVFVCQCKALKSYFACMHEATFDWAISMHIVYKFFLEFQEQVMLKPTTLGLQQSEVVKGILLRRWRYGLWIYGACSKSRATSIQLADRHY